MSPLFTLGLIGLGIVAALLVLASTTTGIGTTPDSIHYIAAAHSLLAGDGFLRYGGGVFDGWPPLFPIILALVKVIAGAARVDYLECLRWLQALTFAAVVVAAGLFFRRYMRPSPLPFVAALAVLFGAVLLDHSVYVLTESLFVVLVIVFVYYLPPFLESASPRLLVVVSATAALACLQRYLGVTLIVLGVMSILALMRQIPVWMRVRYALTLGVLAGAPLGIWIVRNLLLSSSPIGAWGPRYLAVTLIALGVLSVLGIAARQTRLPARLRYGLIVVVLAVVPIALASVRRNLLAASLQRFGVTYDQVLNWFLPEALSIGYFRLGAVILAVGIVLLVLSYRRHGRIDLRELAKPVLASTRVLPVIGFIIIYPAPVLLGNRPIERYFSPLYMVLVWLAFVLLDRASQWLGARFNRQRLAQAAAVGVAAMWLLYPLSRTLDEVEARAGWCCQNAEARRSPLVVWLQTHPLAGPAYSNTTLPLLYAGVYSTSAPRSMEQWSPITLAPGRNHYLILFDDAARYTCPAPRFCYDVPYSIEELGARFALTPLVETEDGGVYQLASRR